LKKIIIVNTYKIYTFHYFSIQTKPPPHTRAATPHESRHPTREPLARISHATHTIAARTHIMSTLKDRTAVVEMIKKPRTSVWDTHPSIPNGMHYVRVVVTFTSRPVVGFHLEKLQVYEYTGKNDGPLKDRGMNCVFAPYPSGIIQTTALQMAEDMLRDRLRAFNFQLKIDDVDYDSASNEHLATRALIVQTWSASVLDPARIAEAVCARSGYLHAWTDAGKPTLAEKNATGYMQPISSRSNSTYDLASYAWGQFCSSPRVSVAPVVLEFGNGDIEENNVAFCTGTTCAQALYETGVANVSTPSDGVYLIAKEGAPHGNNLQTEEHLHAESQYLLKKPCTPWGKWSVVDRAMFEQLYESHNTLSAPFL